MLIRYGRAVPHWSRQSAWSASASTGARRGLAQTGMGKDNRLARYAAPDGAPRKPRGDDDTAMKTLK